MTQNELREILSKHTRWLRGDGGKKADLSGVDLSRANLSDADLREIKLNGANLSHADLREANLELVNLSRANLQYTNLSNAKLQGADLRDANLTDADLSNARLNGANLTGANLSGAKGILSQEEFLRINFERDSDGYIAYKTFGSIRKSPENWVIEPGSILCENVNFNRTQECGCGINVAPLGWVKEYADGVIWRVRIRWEWLMGVCVPYMSDGKIRCEKVELIEIVER